MLLRKIIMELEKYTIENIDELMNDIQILKQRFNLMKTVLDGYKNSPMFDFEKNEVGIKLFKQSQTRCAKALKKLKALFIEGLNIYDLDVQNSLVNLLDRCNNTVVSFANNLTTFEKVKKNTFWEIIGDYYFCCALTDMSLKALDCLEMVASNAGAELGYYDYRDYSINEMRDAIIKLKNTTSYVEKGTYILEMKNQ